MMQLTSSMQEFSAYSTFAATIWLILRRPRLGFKLRLKPVFAATLGVILFSIFGLLTLADFLEAGKILWSPLLTIACIMVLSSVADRLGVFHWLSRFAEGDQNGSVARLYRRIFVLAAICSAVLNNDTTILMLTPFVITLIRRRYPEHPQLIIPFAFAVFMACGGSPFIVSNPMNMVVASIAELDFNVYAKTMIPITIAACTVSYFFLKMIYAKELAIEAKPVCLGPFSWSKNPGCAHAVVLLLAIFSLYPVMALFRGPVWLVASLGAIVAILLARHHTDVKPTTLLRTGISWETLGFLVAVFLLGAGLRNAGIVNHVTEFYHHAGIFTIGITSALGSAVMDNHPMAIVNIMALGGPAADSQLLFAALVGGDLGPRLLPMGSLAGLIWMAQLERSGVKISIFRFFKIGSLVMIPTLLTCLALLFWL